MVGLENDSRKPHSWDRVESIFHQVMELPESDRLAAASRLAGSDRALSAEVESLVRAAANSALFLESRQGLGSEIITQIISHWASSRSGHGLPSLAAPTSRMAQNEESKGLEVLETKVTFARACEFLATYRPELQLLEQVGEGAAGIVVRAHDQRMGRDVAVKLLHANWAARLGENYLEREAQAASLSSDYVVRVYEVAPPNADIPFLVLEWISGPTLRELLAHKTALPPREAARLILHVARGLTSAHQHGFVHGDIKPANVMLEPIINSGINSRAASAKSLDSSNKSRAEYSLVTSNCRAKLADFGLARRLSSSAFRSLESRVSVGLDSDMPAEDSDSRPTHFMGTPAYASPEQLLEGKFSSIASDIYSVGATLYHALVGAAPYSGRPHAIMRQMSSQDIQSPRKLDSRIPKDLESICLKALAYSPDRRYLTAMELADDLERFLDGHPVQARPISAPQRFVRMIQRRPLIASLIGLLAITLTSGIVISNAFRIRAEKNFRLASANLERAAAERDRAKAVINLLQGMISAADVNYGDRDVKLVDALTGLESRIANDLAEMPDIEADVSRTLGNMYFSIADYEKSRFHFERAMELRGPQQLSQDLLEDRIALANTLRWLYLPGEALKLSQENWRDSEKLLGSDHETTLRAGEVLAGCYQDMGRYPDGERIFRAVLERAELLLGKEHERTLLIRSGLASLLIDSGRYPIAEVELKNIIGLREEIGKSSTREMLILGSNLGTVLSELGRLDEAIVQQRENARLSAQLLGELHDSTISSTLNLAESLRRAGRMDEALSTCRQILSRCAATLGWENNRTLGALESVVLNLVRSQEYEAALELVDSAESNLRSLLNPSSDWMLKLASYRAAALSGLDQHEQAIPLYQKAVEHFESKYGRSHVTTLTLINNFGVALIAARRAEEAIVVFSQLLIDTEGKFDSMQPVLLRNLGHGQLLDGQLAIAEETLVQAKQLSLSRGESDNVERCEQLIRECQVAEFKANSD